MDDVMDKFKNLDYSELFIVIVVFVMIVLAIFMGAQALSGVFLGFLTSVGIGFLLLYARQGAPRIWNFIVNGSAIIDILISAAVVAILTPSTVTGIIGGAAAGIFVSGMLLLFRKLIGPVNLENK